MSLNIDFYFDFGSPNAYLSYKVIPEIEARIGPAFNLKPALLGGIFKATGNQSPAVTLAAVPAKRKYEQLELQRFVQRHGLADYRHNPFFPVNTLNMMRGAILAQRLGIFEAYVAAVYSGMWEQQLNMGDPDVYHGVLEAAGLPAQEFASGNADPEIKQALINVTEEAIARGTFGSPTFFVGDEIFFGKDRLQDAAEEFLRQQGAHSATT